MIIKNNHDTEEALRKLSELKAKPGYYDLEEIKQIPILKVLNDVYGIKVTVRGSKAFCSIRNERTASCCVYLDTNTYCDFGDGNKGGNVINLIQNMNQCDFYEALAFLGEQYGITPQHSQSYGKSLPSNFQYNKIGIQADMASKNFSLDPVKYGFDNTKKFADKYRCSVQELSRIEPRTYHNMLRCVAIPYIDNCRNEYYYSLYQSYQISKTLGMSENEYTYQDCEFKLKEQIEREEIMKNSITDFSLLKFIPKEYNIKKDVEQILSGKIQIQCGNIPYVELKTFAKKNNSEVAYIPIGEKDFFHNTTMTNIPYAAYLNVNKHEVNVCVLQKDKEKFLNLYSKKKEHHIKNSNELER